MMADEKEDYVMTVDILFTSNGSLTVTVETQGGQLFNIHYVQTNHLITMEGTDIFYGVGTDRRGRWIRLARDIKIDLQKGRVDAKIIIIVTEWPFHCLSK
jgi:heparosan-N-sulfate-glucuronate 5-epimerase